MQTCGENTFQYSSTGELLKTSSSGQETSYTIDPLGRRAAKSNEAGTYQYFYGNPNNMFQITESQSPDGQTSRYYYDPAGRLMAVDRDGSRYYVAADQLGTPKLVTDSNGSIIKMLQYDSYGNIINDSAPDFYLPIGFAGGLADDSAGLVRFGFRDYDPIAGRWTAKDPILYQSGQGNLYVYNGNNPVEFKDPSGLKKSPCQDDVFSGTTGWGFEAQAACGVKLGISVQYIYDKQLNRGIEVSVIPFTGGGTPSMGICGVRSTSNAKSIEDLRGWTTNGGGSVSYILGLGEEGNWGGTYSGQTTSVGVKGPPEIHADRSYSWVWVIN